MHWYNTQRLLEPIGNVSPVEYEMNLCLLFIHPRAANSIGNTDTKLLIYGLFRVLAQDGVHRVASDSARRAALPLTHRRWVRRLAGLERPPLCAYDDETPGLVEIRL